MILPIYCFLCSLILHQTNPVNVSQSIIPPGRQGEIIAGSESNWGLTLGEEVYKVNETGKLGNSADPS